MADWKGGQCHRLNTYSVEWGTLHKYQTEDSAQYTSSRFYSLPDMCVFVSVRSIDLGTRQSRSGQDNDTPMAHKKTRQNKLSLLSQVQVRVHVCACVCMCV